MVLGVMNVDERKPALVWVKRDGDHRNDNERLKGPERKTARDQAGILRR